MEECSPIVVPRHCPSIHSIPCLYSLLATSKMLWGCRYSHRVALSGFLESARPVPSQDLQTFPACNLQRCGGASTWFVYICRIAFVYMMQAPNTCNKQRAHPLRKASASMHTSLCQRSSPQKGGPPSPKRLVASSHSLSKRFAV